jgi:hypothetical protein
VGSKVVEAPLLRRRMKIKFLQKWRLKLLFLVERAPGGIMCQKRLTIT